MADVKNYLYTWCSKNGKNLSYEYKSVGTKTPQFICQAFITTIDYVAQGVASNKKEAQGCAAKNFVDYLVNEGYIPQDYDVENVPKESAQSYFSDCVEKTDEVKRKQKLEEFDRIDDTAVLHGDWKLENAKTRLHHFLQSNRISTQYEYKVVGTSLQNKSYIADMSIYLKDKNTTITASEHGPTKIAASKACALMLLRQLFHMDLIEPYDKSSSANKENGVDWNMEPYMVNLHPEVDAEFDQALETLQLIPINIVPEKAILNVKSYNDLLSEINIVYPDATFVKPSPQLWNGPVNDWDTWSCTEISTPIDFKVLNEQLKKEWTNKVENFSILTKILDERKNLPIFNYEPVILEAIRKHSVVIIKGSPGIGKTTQIPQYIIDEAIAANRGAECCVCVCSGGCVQSTALAATQDLASRIACHRMCEERLENISLLPPSTLEDDYAKRRESTAGYQGSAAWHHYMGHDNDVLQQQQRQKLPRPFGSVLYCNTVYLLQRIIRYGLKGISHLIIDEVYERDSMTEFILMLVRDILRIYAQFKLIIISSDLAIDDIEEYFDSPHIITIQTPQLEVGKYFLEDCVEMTEFDYDGSISSAYAKIRRRKKTKMKKKLPGVMQNLNYTTESLAKTEDYSENFLNDEESLINMNACVPKTYKPETRQACLKLPEKDISFELIYHVLDYIMDLKDPGTIAIILPNLAYIQSLHKYLMDISKISSGPFKIYELHEFTSYDDWKKMNNKTPLGYYKLILSTNIGECCVTFNDIIYVIDSCKVERQVYDARTDTTTKLIVTAPKSVLEMRYSLASHYRPGFCFHLISRARYERLPSYSLFPSNLTQIFLAAQALSESLNETVLQFYAKLLRPDTYCLKQCVCNLLQLGALEIPQPIGFTKETLTSEQLFEKVKLTSLGKILVNFPFDPKIGKMMIASCILGVADSITALVALQANPDIFMQTSTKRLQAILKSFSGLRQSDVIARLMAYKGYLETDASNKMTYMDENFLIPNFCENVKRSQTYLKQALHVLLNISYSTLEPNTLNPFGKDSHLDTIMALLNIGYNFNIVYSLGKRYALLGKHVLAVMNKNSIVSLTDEKNQPFFLFTEKVLSKNRIITDLSTSVPLQFLLFGTYQFYLEPNQSVVTINDWIRLSMESVLLAKLILLRGAFDKMINIVCHDSSLIHKLSELASLLGDKKETMLEPRIIKSGLIVDMIYALSEMDAGRLGLTSLLAVKENGDSAIDLNNGQDAVVDDDVMSIGSLDSGDSFCIPYQKLGHVKNLAEHEYHNAQFRGKECTFLPTDLSSLLNSTTTTAGDNADYDLYDMYDADTYTWEDPNALSHQFARRNMEGPFDTHRFGMRRPPHPPPFGRPGFGPRPGPRHAGFFGPPPPHARFLGPRPPPPRMPPPMPMMGMRGRRPPHAYPTPLFMRGGGGGRSDLYYDGDADAAGFGPPYGGNRFGVFPKDPGQHDVSYEDDTDFPYNNTPKRGRTSGGGKGKAGAKGNSRKQLRKSAPPISNNEYDHIDYTAQGAVQDQNGDSNEAPIDKIAHDKLVQLISSTDAKNLTADMIKGVRTDELDQVLREKVLKVRKKAKRDRYVQNLKQKADSHVAEKYKQRTAKYMEKSRTNNTRYFNNLISHTDAQKLSTPVATSDSSKKPVMNFVKEGYKNVQQPQSNLNNAAQMTALQNMYSAMYPSGFNVGTTTNQYYSPYGTNAAVSTGLPQSNIASVSKASTNGQSSFTYNANVVRYPQHNPYNSYQSQPTNTTDMMMGVGSYQQTAGAFQNPTQANTYGMQQAYDPSMMFNLTNYGYGTSTYPTQ